ncbi:MAG: hypothetical protein GY715_17430, partial [Planctomycetes bacterium]|nr:hypothetical protein [Planctomycetota bacterium]
PGTPWQGQTDGVLASDSDQRNAAEGGDAFDPAVHDDLYPSVISGLVAVSGDLQVGMNDSPTFEGVIVVGGQVTSDSGSTLTITYRDTFLLDAPPGFGVHAPGPLRVTTGSVEQIVQP